MKEINVNLEKDSYKIIIGENSLEKFFDIFPQKEKVLIITDSNIPKTYLQTLMKNYEKAYFYEVSSGEASKSFENVQKIIEYMILHNFTRHDAIIALGGGVVGDLSGFIASMYMRGISFYNIPTSLLAMVDSSIGGKTAIDFLNIKNIVGAFYQPKGVLIDPLVLKTLDQRNFNAGLIEAYKMALCFNEELVKKIEQKENIENIIIDALLIKKSVIEEDPMEKNLRKVLNFGHTFGHAIEAYFPFQYLHGECVGFGMKYVTSGDVKKRIGLFLEKLGLTKDPVVSKSELIDLIKHDKKASSEDVDLVVVKNVGTFEFVKRKFIDLRGDENE